MVARQLNKLCPQMNLEGLRFSVDRNKVKIRLLGDSAVWQRWFKQPLGSS